MIKPLSLPKIRFENDEWTIQQTFEKNGRERVVYAYGITRNKALENFEIEKLHLKHEKTTTLFDDLAGLLWDVCGLVDILVDLLKPSRRKS